MTHKRMITAILAGVLGIVSSGPVWAVSDTFRKDCEALTGTPHRLTGSPEYRTAADHIEKRLTEIGVDKIIVQPFLTAQTRPQRCEIQIEGSDKPLEMLPMRPCGIIAPVTPPEGITGRIVHIGKGKAADLSAKSVEDAICIMEYNAEDGWLKAFRLGAKAVIFVMKDTARANQPHFVEANANLLRYYYTGDASDFPEGRTATIHCEVLWREAVGRNVIGFLRGTDPVFSQEKDELIILAANLDSFGEVPRLSPGARVAANCAGLLRLAEHFQKVRPRRHVLFIFFDGQSRGHLGSSIFYRALEEKRDDATVDERKEYMAAEKEFLAKMSDLVALENPLEQESDVRRQLLNRLSDKAAEQAYTISDIMYELRDEMIELRGGRRRAGPPRAPHPNPEARTAEIQTELKEKWKPKKDEWNNLRRALGQTRRSMSGDRTKDLGPAEKAKLHQILDIIRNDVKLRSDELAIEESTLNADIEIKELIGESWISLHISLLLGDNTPTWGLIIGGESALHSSQDNPGLYGKIQAVFLRGYQGMAEQGIAPKHFLSASADQTLSQTRVLWGAPFLIHSGEVAGLFGIYNICLGTCQERLQREGTPHDTLDRLNLGNIESQVDEIGSLLSAVADLEAEKAKNGDVPVTPTTVEGGGPDSERVGPGGPENGVAAAAAGDDQFYAVASQEGLSLRRGIVANKEYIVAGFEDDSPRGPMVMGVLPGSSIPNTPMPGAVVQFKLKPSDALAFNRRKPYAFDNFQLLWTSRNGGYGLGPVTGGWIWRVRGGFAAVFDKRGAVKAVSDSDSYTKVRWRLNVFEGNAGFVVLPPQVKTGKLAGEEVKVLSARANALLDKQKSFVETADGVACWYSDEREKAVKLFSLRQCVGLNNGGELLADKGTKEKIDAQGMGFSMEVDWEPVNSALRSASDLWRLNESRLQVLRSKRILDSSLAELHGRAEDILTEAKGEKSPFRREALAASAFLASQPLYNKIRGLLDDLVFAVIILLALCVPFAFALERVVIGATTIYKQISWFVGIFLLTFFTLYMSHPAFAIANTPIIIFLGFAIVVMSSLVIFIIMRKFEVELKALQGMTTTVHAADVSHVNTLMAAMQMGISTMRRRPLRTALTAVTIILLTFTILCFASFGTQSGIVTLLSAPNPAYNGAFVHNVNWDPLSPNLTDLFSARWEGRVKAFPRLWISPQTQDKPGMLITRDDGTQPVTIRGVLGLQPEEIDQRPDLQEIFDRNLEGSVLITGAVARALDVKEGDTVLVGGKTMRVGKLLDAVMVSAAKDMDTSSVLPADFTEASSAQQTQMDEEDALLVEKNWASLPVDSVAIVSAKAAMDLGAQLYALQIYTRDTSEAIDIAGEIARMLPLPVAATRSNGVYRHVLGTVLAASGMKDLFFPILLGGLVIFGTMLGSVADREKEIYTFSALGLAPKHVATLFFAESMVYSLIGGMGGYLMAQGTLKVLMELSEYGIVRVPEMNMSSTNTIFTILVVMATVLVSAIYPAIKASKSANPGLLRVWRPPEPDGDLLDLVFPFTVSEYDITGVVSFLREHFNNHTDTGLGRFMTSGAKLVQHEDDGSLGLDAILALAPFDLGVSQSFSLRSAPSEIPGIDEVRVILQRKSGQPKDWSRLNKVFMDDLRQQFLLWRSIPHETMELYRERTLIELGRIDETAASKKPEAEGGESATQENAAVSEDK